jgi:hypothetical protein
MSNPQIAGTTLGNFRPTDIGGLSVWIDASQTGSFTLTGGTSNLATLTDLAESTTYTISGTPTWSSTAFVSADGRSYPAFNMTNGRLVRALTNGCTTFQNTTFIVAKRDNLTGDGFTLVGLATTTTGSGQYFRVLDNRDAANASFRSVAFATNIFALSNANTTSPFLFDTTFNGVTTIDSRIFVNGNLRYPWTFGGTAAAFTAGSNGNAVMIGTDAFTGAQTTNQWPGTVCEVLIYRNTVFSTSNREIVEGYLAQKWGLAANLPLGQPYAFPTLLSTAPPTGFNPRSISGMTLWLDAQDTTTITGNPVTTWTDKSGSGFNATSAAGPSQSTYNGYPVLSFNGTNQRMTSSHTVNPASHTLILVYRPAILTGSFSGNTSVFRYQPSGPYIVFPYMNGATQRGYITSYDGVPIDAGNSTLVPNSVTTALNISIVRIASGSQQVFLNGRLQTANTQSLTAGTSGTLAIGYYPPGNSEFFQGDLGEMIVYSRQLTIDEINTLTLYLTWKWGAQILATLPFSNYLPLLALAGPFSPLSISGLSLWLDAADTSRITTSGTTVTAWQNKGSTGGSATNVGTGAAGVCTSGVISQAGNNVIRCPAGAGLSITFASPNQARAWFIVAKNTTQMSPSVLYWATVNQTQGSGQDSPFGPGGYSSGGSTYTMGSGPSGFFACINTAVAPEPFNAMNLYVWQVSAVTTGLNTCSVNGTPIPLSTNILAQSYRTDSVAYIVNTPGYNTGADICEICFYNAEISLSQRQTLEGYLAWKWGLVANLPAGHPFKLYPPPP